MACSLKTDAHEPAGVRHRKQGFYCGPQLAGGLAEGQMHIGLCGTDPFLTLLLPPGIIFNDHRAETSLKQMPRPIVREIEPEAVADVEPLQRTAQVGLGGLHQLFLATLASCPRTSASHQSE